MEGPLLMFSDQGLLAKAFQDGKYVNKGISVLEDVFKGADDLLKEYFTNFTVTDLLKKSMAFSELPSLDRNTISLKDFLQKEMMQDEHGQT